MKIPKKIKVGCHIYDVEEKKTNDREKGRDFWGRTYLADKKIYIDKDISTSQKEETLIHELFHIAFHQARVSDDIYDKIILTEEQIVNRVSVVFFQILEDNNLLK